MECVTPAANSHTSPWWGGQRAQHAGWGGSVNESDAASGDDAPSVLLHEAEAEDSVLQILEQLRHLRVAQRLV